jgi:hypothetical protein
MTGTLVRCSVDEERQRVEGSGPLGYRATA